MELHLGLPGDTLMDAGQRMLDRMIVTYDRGLLVPFIGAGMSHPGCRLWRCFVVALENPEDGHVPSNDEDCQVPCNDPDLAHRAALAVRKLRFGAGKSLADAVAGGLSAGPVRPPDQTTQLASIFWPLVVTTNYDDLYLAAAHQAYLESRGGPSPDEDKEMREAPLLLLGRSRADCQRVLTSLRQPDVPILWALQGFVGGQAAPLPHQHKANPARKSYLEHLSVDDRDYFRRRWEPLAKELVVGHAEYRRVAMASEPFRRAFAELYRSRSLLFLGSGLRDKYFLDLFSEIMELYGPSPQAHYAFLKTGELDVEFLRQYFGIWVWEMGDYDELPDRLREFKERVEGVRERQIVWHVGRAAIPSSSGSGELTGLRIVRGELPSEPADGGCIVFSAGKARSFGLSHVGERILQNKGLGYDESAGAFQPLERREVRKLPLWRHQTDDRFLAVKARIDPRGEDGARLRPTDPTLKPIGHGEPSKLAKGARRWRDIRLVSLAVEELMRAVQCLGFRHVDCMLLAGGELRTFARSHALLQMVRGWAKWRRQATSPLPDLSIHLTASDVLYDLDAGRLELTSNLVPDVAQFWFEIKQDEEVERYLAVEQIDRPLLEVLAEFDIDDDDWKLDLLPNPCLDWANWTLERVRAWTRHFGDELSLETFGVLPGSTLKAFKPDATAR